MRGYTRNYMNNTNSYTNCTLNSKVQPITCLPEVADKSTFLIMARMVLQEITNSKKQIYEQIFLLTKTYENTINRNKVLFENNLNQFMTLVNNKTLNNNLTLRTIMNNQVASLIKSMNDYEKYENTVRNNINIYINNCAKSYSYLSNGITSLKLKDDTVANFVTQLPNSRELDETTFPSLYFCKKDLLNEIKVVNSFCDNFIQMNNLQMPNTSTIYQENELKGDRTL